MTTVRRSVIQPARAKINLTLRVHGRRADGYHELESLVTFADVGDGVRVETGGPFRLAVEGPHASNIEGENLIERAHRVLASLVPDLGIGTVTLDKRLPVSSGIGGGSSDAAAFLRAVQDIAPPRTRHLPWDRIARDLGADVPVCLVSQSTLMTGTGEALTWVRDFPRLSAVLVTPDVTVPAAKTREIFRRLAALSLPPQTSRVHPLPIPTSRAEVVRMVTAIGNDLARPALELWPVLAEVDRQLGGAAGCLATGLSGAGPTTFALYDSAAAARDAASAMVERHPTWWIAATSLG
jgi:4-diphosphocytidyl-2-C-methyl-D-erythritol kinase